MQEGLYMMQTTRGSQVSPRIEHSTVTTIELWALRDGLTLAKILSIQKLEIEMDATMTVNLLNQHIPSTHPYYSIISDCRLLMHGFLETMLRHVYREANPCADALARGGGCALSSSLFILHSPFFVSQLLADDACGATFVLFCSIVI